MRYLTDSLRTNEGSLGESRPRKNQAAWMDSDAKVRSNNHGPHKQDNEFHMQVVIHAERPMFESRKHPSSGPSQNKTDSFTVFENSC